MTTSQQFHNVDELTALQLAKEALRDAQHDGRGFLWIRTATLARLIDRAERPHD